MASSNFHSEGLPLLDSAVLSKTIFYSSKMDKIHCTTWVILVIPSHVILIINQMLFIEADTELLNGLVLDLLNYKEWEIETVEAEE